MPDRAPFISLLVAFGNELRAAGMAVGTGDVNTYCAAVAALDPTDLLDLYWSGRTTLVTRREQIPVYDRVFRRFFLDESDDADPMKMTLRVSAASELEIELPSGEPAGDDHEDEEATLGLMASDVAVLREKSFAVCTPEELVALRRIMARIRLTPPRRCTRRTAPAPRRTPARHAPNRSRDDAHPRRASRAVLAPSSAADAAAHPDPGRVRVDVRLLPQPAAVRSLDGASVGSGRSVLLRHATDTDHQGAGASPAGRRHGAGGRGRSSTGTAGRGSATRWRRSFACGVVVGWAAVGSW